MFLCTCTPICDPAKMTAARKKCAQVVGACFAPGHAEQATGIVQRTCAHINCEEMAVTCIKQSQEDDTSFYGTVLFSLWFWVPCGIISCLVAVGLMDAQM